MQGNWIFVVSYLSIIILLVSFFAEGNIQDKYIGCYYDGVNDQPVLQRITLQNTSILSIEFCIRQCSLGNSAYARLENSEACLCGNNFGVSLPDASCNSLCPGNQSEYCGGSNGQRNVYSLYTVCEIGFYGNRCDQVCHCKREAPCARMTGNCSSGCEGKWFGSTCSETNISDKYIGCYRDDDKPRAISGPPYLYTEQMTVEVCSSTCLMKNNSIVGLQAYGFCFCGESYARYGRINEGYCNQSCRGDHSQFCGGDWANSVYSVCLPGYYGPKCHNQCHCYNNSRCVYSIGTCDTPCEAGWIGDSCNIRDCMMKNGGCSQNETCTTVDLKFATITRCRCLEGYQMTDRWDGCQDVDECVLGYCDASTTNCTNTVGSYNCACKPGFRKLNNTFCDDIDECDLELDSCSSSTEECNNTIGSFFCNCRTGFQSKKGTCEDIDECISSPCDKSTICSNTQGSFDCNCRPGFSLINSECKEFNTGAAGPIAGAVVGSVLGAALIVAIVLLVLFLHRRRRPEKLVDQLEELPSSSQEILVHQRSISLYGEGSNTYEEIEPAPGNALKTLHSKLSDPDSLKEEFQSVSLRPMDFCALGTMAEVKKKNRFANIIPYEFNRVVLSTKTDDDTSQYINASYVQGYSDVTKFIATQGPREETLVDFWRMIFENRVHLVVMITNLVENQKTKCEKYWPELGHPVVYGDITVTLNSEDSWPDYIVRCIRCSKKSESVDLKQLHYLSWPDHGVPSDIKGFLTFRRIVRQRMKLDKYTVIHCSAGAGRTGAFIAIDYLIEQEKVEHDVKILDCLKRLRDQRSQMIQNLAQYIFVHNALVLAFEIGDTVIPTTQFVSKYKQFQTKDAASGKSILEKQFQFLEQVNMEPEETANHRVRSNVVEQNKMNDMNAVFVQSWKLKDAYIAAKYVDPFTNIWELMMEQGCTVMILFDTTPGAEDSLFPTKGHPKTLSSCTLVYMSATKEKYGSRYIVSKLKEQEDTTYANVGNVGSSDVIYQNTGSVSTANQITVQHVTEFMGKGSWDANRLTSLYNVVNSLTSKKNNVQVMVVSSDFSLSGFCLAAFNAFEMMKQEQMIDVYQIVQNIRKSNTELFNSMSSYIDLHDVVESYITMSSRLSTA